MRRPARRRGAGTGTSWKFRLIASAAALPPLLFSCRPVPRLSVDLLASLRVVDVRFERVGQSLITDRDDPGLRSGWAEPRFQPDGKVVVWATGSGSEIAFHLNRPRPLALRFVAQSAIPLGTPDPQMEVSLNDAAVATVQLRSTAPGRYELALPEASLRPGDNRLRLNHPWGKSAAAGQEGELLPLAVMFSELAIVTPGSPVQGAKAAELPEPPFFGYAVNWGELEDIPDPGPFHWALGQSAEGAFKLDSVDRGIEFKFSAQPFRPVDQPEQRLTWILNGYPIKSLVIADGWNAYSMVLPAQFLKAGDNRLALKAEYAISPRAAHMGEDDRVLSVALANPRFAWEAGTGVVPFPNGELFRRAGKLVQPSGSELAFTLTLASSARLHLSGTPSAPARVTVRCATDVARNPAPLFDRRVTVPLDATMAVCGAPGETVTLAITVDSDGPGAAAFAYDSLSLLGQDRLVAPVLSRAPDLPAAASAPVSRRPRTILIYLVDTLRQDHLGAYGYQRQTSPRLDEFSRSAERFTNAWAVTSWTKAATASVLTGLPPERHGAGLDLSPLQADVSYLPALMKPLGYRTEAVITNPFVGPNFGFKRDFDAFHFLYDAAHPGVSSAVANRELAAVLGHTPAEQQLLVYMHTIDPHSPYTPPAAFNRFTHADPGQFGSRKAIDEAQRLGPSGRFPAEARDAMRDLYDGEILLVDDSFGKALQLLKAAGRDQDALVVFLADHGEEFEEHGGYEHGQTLFGEVTRIPLLIRWPDSRGGGMVRAEPVSQLDILPTLLQAAGAPAAGLPGRSLREPVPARQLVSSLNYQLCSQVCVMEERWKYCRSGNRLPPQLAGKPMEYLFDLDADPGEQENLTDAHPVLAARLRAASRELLHEDMIARTNSADAETLRQLHALGYLNK
jgi:arylsulfatase A-like enzyme